MKDLKIFISYRRADEPAYAHLIKNKLDLCPSFNPNNIFLDVQRSGIQIGEFFDDVIRDSIRDSDVLIVIIGSQWAKIMHERSSDETDWVRLEIATALKYSKFVIPVLANHNQVPDSNILPQSIKDICRLNVAQVRVGRDFETDVQQIIEAIENRFPSKIEQFITNAKQIRLPQTVSKLWGEGCIFVPNPKGFQSENRMKEFITEHVGYSCSCMSPNDVQPCAFHWHTWRVKDKAGRSLKKAVAFCGKDNLKQSGNFKLNLNKEGLDEMITEAKALEYRVVPCPDSNFGRVIISPPEQPNEQQLTHMGWWIQIARILSTL